MLVFLSIILLIIIFMFLLWIDYKLGQKNHLQNLHSISFQKTSGDYRLFTTGNELFDTYFQDILDAKKQIDIMFYIVRDDEISNKLLDLLMKKAQEGVQVRLLLDRIGSHHVKKVRRKALKDAGVNFAFSQKPTFPYFFYKLNRRNHRKISVIDEEIGFVGGYNVGNEYLGKDPRLGNWRDYHLRLTGNVVKDLHLVFRQDWALTTKQKIEHVHPSPSGQKTIQLVATDGKPLEEVFVKMIDQAKTEILIGTPYFIPTEKVLSRLKAAVDRGVDIKLIVPMKADHALVKEANIVFIKKLHEIGGHVYLFDYGFYHAKVMIVDQELCDLGTANFDRRSLFLNKEINALTFDTPFIEVIRKAFLDDLSLSQPLTDQWLNQLSFFTRVKMVIANMVKGLL